VNVTAPVWTALLVSALGGALLTGVVSVGLRVIDLRHRNDEIRRDNYVALLAAFDGFFEALVIAYGLHNRARDPSEAGTQPAPVEQSAALAAVDQARNTARRAELRTRLFAPDRVDLRVEKVFGDLLELRRSLHGAAAATELIVPSSPSVRWNDLLNEMRRDLGVRALPERVLGE
jgi:hypothetical protein